MYLEYWSDGEVERRNMLTGKFGEAMTSVLTSGHTVFHNFGDIQCPDLIFFF